MLLVVEVASFLLPNHHQRMIHALALRHARLVSLFCVLGNVNTGLGYSNNDMVLFYYVFADDMIWHNPIFLGFFLLTIQKKEKKECTT